MTEILIAGLVVWVLVDAGMLWCCCAINRGIDEYEKIANGCDFQNTER